MEHETYGRHVHKWHAIERTRLEVGEGGFVVCECGEQQFLTEHELAEFFQQRQRGIESTIDEDGLRPSYPAEA